VRWPWQRRDEGHAVVHPPCTHEDDEKGLAEAHEALNRALSNWPEVTEVSETIRGIRRRNHLAEKISEAWGAHPR
jgi:endonuclease IV